MGTKKENNTVRDPDTLKRAREIKERIVRIGVRQAAYRIQNPSSGRIIVGDRDKSADPYSVHLAPPRR